MIFHAWWSIIGQWIWHCIKLEMLILITQKLTEKPNLHLNLLNSQHSFPNKFKKELLTGSLVSGGLLTFFPNASWKKKRIWQYSITFTYSQRIMCQILIWWLFKGNKLLSLSLLSQNIIFIEQKFNKDSLCKACQVQSNKCTGSK